MDNGLPYKDSPPHQTVQRIRDILMRAGIFTVETNWTNNMESFFSCRVAAVGTDFGTNGKGTSPEASLASAYAEFMERVQNYFIQPKAIHSPKDMAQYGFAYEPAERRIIAQELPSLPECFESATPFTDKEPLTSFWRRYASANKGAPLVLLPFFEVQSAQVEYLPVQFLSPFYGSNGMAAGNSPPEALTQAFCEIFERYSQREIFFRRLRPPTIPREYLEKHAPRQFRQLQQIVDAGRYQIIVKDCSLGKGLPVVAIFYYDSRSNCGCVKFGSDPDPRIALERCFTELLQGCMLGDHSKVLPLSLRNDNYDEDLQNYFDLVTVGRSRFPNSFFAERSDYPFKGFPEKGLSTSSQRLAHVVGCARKLIAKNGKIYVKDRSSMGFCSYYVIIPGVSEAFVISDRMKEILQSGKEVRMYLTRLDRLDDTELKELKRTVEHAIDYDLGNRRNVPLSRFFPIPQFNNASWNKVSLDQFLAMISMRQGDHASVARYTQRFLDNVKHDFKNLDLEYFHCFNRYFELMEAGRSRAEAVELLRVLFPKETSSMVEKDTSDPALAFQYLPLPRCFDCEKCAVKDTCSYEQIQKIYLAVKKSNAETPLDQSKLGAIVGPGMGEC